ncbi:MAG: DUF6807 family protein [Planctomycetota bacterium]
MIAVVCALLLAQIQGEVTPLRLPIELDPGGIPRHGSPVTLRLHIPEELPWDARKRLGPRVRARLLTSTDAPLASVLQTEWSKATLLVHFVQAKLTRKERLILELAPEHGEAAPEDTRASFSFSQGDGYRELLLGKRRVLRHVKPAYDPARHEATCKTFHHVYGLHGEGALTKGAGGLYSHHRGLFAGWRQTRRGDETWDFWHCREGVAVRHLRDLPELETAGAVLARMASSMAWTSPGGSPVVRERRVIEAWNIDAGKLLLAVTITLASARGQVLLEGDAHHAGFQFRAAQAVAERRTQTRYVRPEGAQKQPNDVWSHCPWAACLFELHGRRYAVLHMDHPENPRPMTYSTRDYGRFGSFFEAELDPGSPLTLRYRILVIDRTMHPDCSPERFALAYRDFVRPVGRRIEK